MVQGILKSMAQLLALHPDNPQERLLKQAVQGLHEGAVIAMPTDTTYVLACHLGDKTALDRIRSIRRLPETHLMSLLCSDLSSLGSYAKVDNAHFRLLKGLTPGPFTFILTASREVPKRLLDPKRKTIGLRIPDSVLCQKLLSALGEPLIISTLILPEEELPLTEGYDIKERLDDVIDLIIDTGACGILGTTVIDATGAKAELLRQGLGDASRYLS